MAYYVYIIQSEVDNSFYKGFSEDPQSLVSQFTQARTEEAVSLTSALRE